MFELDSSIKVKSSSLARVWYEPKKMFELELVRKPKGLSLVSFGLVWLISQVKLELNIKLKLELMSSFWVWDPNKII